jgi:cytochrome c553
MGLQLDFESSEIPAGYDRAQCRTDGRRSQGHNGLPDELEMKTQTAQLSTLILAFMFLFSCKDQAPVGIPGKEVAGSDSTMNSSRQAMYSMTHSERTGQRLFDKYCVVCHGQDGQGDGFNAYNLDPHPRNLADTIYMNTLSDARLSEMITEGGRGTGKSALMPAYGSTLTASEIHDLVDYIRYLSRK